MGNEPRMKMPKGRPARAEAKAGSAAHQGAAQPRPAGMQQLGTSGWEQVRQAIRALTRPALPR
jgi:hypothetical protein